jgi:hypothetical protein
MAELLVADVAEEAEVAKRSQGTSLAGTYNKVVTFSLTNGFGIGMG